MMKTATNTPVHSLGRRRRIHVGSIGRQLSDVNFDIPFEHIQSIEKLSDRTGRVVLWDGRELKLRDSNDVNDENNGVFVATGTGGKDEVEIDWTDFDRVEFQKK